MAPLPAAEIAAAAALQYRHRPQTPAENDTSAGESLDWLTRYAVVYPLPVVPAQAGTPPRAGRYEGTKVNLDNPHGLLEAVTDLVETIADRIKTLTGIEPPHWTPPE